MLYNFDPAVDYFPPELRAMVAEGGAMPTTVTFATDFSIDYHHTFKVLRNLKNGKVYVLHQCGAGDISTIAADLPADAVDAPVFEVPVQSWSTGSTVPIAFMELLGLIGKAALIDPQYASSACTQKLHQCGVIDTVVPGGFARLGARRRVGVVPSRRNLDALVGVGSFVDGRDGASDARRCSRLRPTSG